VNRERIAWIIIVALVLIAGFLISQRFLPAIDNSDAGSFRQWLWDRRGLDLFAQVCLVFAGALGIAALLPRGKESE
jgi:hypothetical protein